MASKSGLTFSNHQVAVITGGSSGLGRGAAVKLAQKGITKFCLTARNQQGLEETRRLCLQHAAAQTSVENFVIVAGKKNSLCDFQILKKLGCDCFQET